MKYVTEWYPKDHFEGRPLPKRWKWETDECEMCGHGRWRHKVYAVRRKETEMDRRLERFKYTLDSRIFTDGTGKCA